MTVAFLDDYTAKSEVKLINSKAQLYNVLIAYKQRSEVEQKDKGLVIVELSLSHVKLKEFVISKLRRQVVRNSHELHWLEHLCDGRLDQS